MNGKWEWDEKGIPSTYSHIIIMIEENDIDFESNKYENIFQLKWHASRFFVGI